MSLIGQELVQWTNPNTGLPMVEPPFSTFSPSGAAGGVYLQVPTVAYQETSFDGQLEMGIGNGQSPQVNEVLVGTKAFVRPTADGRYMHLKQGNLLAISRALSEDRTTKIYNFRDFNKAMRESYVLAMQIASQTDYPDQEFQELLRQWLKEGETAFHRKPDTMAKIMNNDGWSIARDLSLVTIRDQWNFKFQMQNWDYEMQHGAPLAWLAVQGPTLASPCDNIWGRLDERSHLFVALTRRAEVREDGTATYHEYQLKPVIGDSRIPRNLNSLIHADPSGEICSDYVFYIGSVYHRPLSRPPTQREIDMALGHAGTDEEAMVSILPKVSVIMGEHAWQREVLSDC